VSPSPNGRVKGLAGGSSPANRKVAGDRRLWMMIRVAIPSVPDVKLMVRINLVGQVALGVLAS